MIIFNKCRDNLDDFIDSSDLKFLDQTKPIVKKSHNTSKFESSLVDFLREDCLKKNIPDR